VCGWFMWAAPQIAEQRGVRRGREDQHDQVDSQSGHCGARPIETQD
jgi:hypothetical protein